MFLYFLFISNQKVKLGEWVSIQTGESGREGRQIVDAVPRPWRGERVATVGLVTGTCVPWATWGLLLVFFFRAIHCNAFEKLRLEIVICRWILSQISIFNCLLELAELYLSFLRKCGCLLIAFGTKEKLSKPVFTAFVLLNHLPRFISSTPHIFSMLQKSPLGCHSSDTLLAFTPCSYSTEAMVKGSIVLMGPEQHAPSENVMLYFPSDLFSVQSFVLKIKEHVHRVHSVAVSMCSVWALQHLFCICTLFFSERRGGTRVDDLAKNPHMFARHSWKASLWPIFLWSGMLATCSKQKLGCVSIVLPKQWSFLLFKNSTVLTEILFLLSF